MEIQEKFALRVVSQLDYFFPHLFDWHNLDELNENDAKSNLFKKTKAKFNFEFRLKQKTTRKINENKTKPN